MGIMSTGWNVGSCRQSTDNFALDKSLEQIQPTQISIHLLSLLNILFDEIIQIEQKQVLAS